MKHWKTLAAVALIAAGVSYATTTRAQGGPVKLEELAWLEGRWGGDALGGHCEEIWSAPSGGSMMGMFRLVTDDKASVYEFLMLEETAKGVTLRFKHYSPGFEPWEKEAPLVLELVRVGAASWTFESPVEGQSPSRMIYTRPDKDQMIVTVETVREGRPEPESFDVPLKRVR